MSTNINAADRWVHAASISDVPAGGVKVVRAGGHTVAIFRTEQGLFAVDNRCPHMGFPLDRGTVKDCILTCHWHHARFDLASGGTFDQWADDVRSFPVEIRDGEIWLDLAPSVDPLEHQRHRLRDGLERDIPLVIAKAVIPLLEGDRDPGDAFRIGLEFGIHNRLNGWGQGLTILSCMRNLLPKLDAADRPRAMYHGLSAVARDSAGHPPRFMVRPLPDSAVEIGTLKRWFRRFVEVRDSDGAERCVVSAIRQGADHRQMADMLFAAATDHRYITLGHPLDFTNKALEALDTAGWEVAEPVLTSLVRAYANADRMEEANNWRNPIDLIPILEAAFARISSDVSDKSDRSAALPGQSDTQALRDSLVPILHGDDPHAIADSLAAALCDGCPPEGLAGIVAYAAALRVAHFHTSNEFGDWDTALHTFTFANAVHQGLRRVRSRELVRGIFDAAMSVYLDRFLNVPAARLPEPGGASADPAALLTELPALLDKQQQVSEAGRLVAEYLYSGGNPDPLIATLGQALLREDRDFHTIQMVEAAVQQYSLLRGQPESAHVLIAAARYLAAHAPTVRAQGQTYQIALRLHRGDHLFEE